MQQPYLMGHTEQERRRLSLQASVLNPLTERFLRRAGIAEGMRVLDLGCGVGEVSLLVAELVGARGHVTGIDIDGASLEIARARAQERRHPQLVFEQSECLLFQSETRYDAVVGRHILLHTSDPLSVIRKAISMLLPGGILAFQEYDCSHVLHGYPELPLADHVMELGWEVFRRATPHGNIGMRLFHLLSEAGLAHPECFAESPIGGGADTPFYEWLAETIRSILPRMEALGLATATEIDIDTLAERLREEALSRRGCIVWATMVGAFARRKR
jgi:ubiquinone/menaquinone biosynthesis C-methylase UbiE